jgi:hypothetical protein
VTLDKIGIDGELDVVVEGQNPDVVDEPCVGTVNVDAEGDKNKD